MTQLRSLSSTISAEIGPGMQLIVRDDNDAARMHW